MPRIWFRGPRLFGLVRPGISFAISELTKPSRRKRGGGSSPDEPAPRFAEYPLHLRIVSWLVFGFAIWGFISMLDCMFSGAHAGSCRVYQDGGYAVTACDNGAYTVTDRHGRKRVYGTPNAGFERYPGQGERPVFERR
jgi:hypothetical protein